MAIKFRKRIKIAPGLHVNIGKKSASVSIGKPGYTVNVGKNGVKETISAPGTGLSYEVRHSKLRPNAAVDERAPEAQAKSSQSNAWLGWFLIIVTAVTAYVVIKH